MGSTQMADQLLAGRTRAGGMALDCSVMSSIPQLLPDRAEGVAVQNIGYAWQFAQIKAHLRRQIPGFIELGLFLIVAAGFYPCAERLCNR